MTNKKLSIPVHGPSFIACRRVRGWSQEELSRRSGYSVRVIRKAEAGGTLKAETLKHLCEAFSQSHGTVEVDALTSDILSLAKKVLESYDLYGIDMLQYCGEYMTEDITYNIHADPARVPYAGSWVGLDGFQKFLSIFFGMFTRQPGILKPVYMVGEQRVHARFLDQAVFQGELTPQIYINLHFQFRGSLVCQMDNEFDSDLTVNSLDEIAGNKDTPAE